MVNACANFPLVPSPCIGVNGIVSNLGIGACLNVSVGFATASVGFRYHWGDSLPSILFPPVTLGRSPSSSRIQMCATHVWRGSRRAQVPSA